MKKRLLLLVGVFCSVVFMNFSPVYAYEPLEVDEIIITTTEEEAAVIGWRYKVVDGKLYRRLFDYTNQRWIGDWILLP